MPRLMFDFRCPNGHVEEAFEDTQTLERLCSHCGEPSSRQISAPRAALDPFTGDFPSAADKWVKNRESHIAKERKYKASTGDYLPGQQVRDKK